MPILKINFIFYGLQYYLDGEKGHKPPSVFEVREIEMSRDRFRSVFIVNLNIAKVFTETIEITIVKRKRASSVD